MSSKRILVVMMAILVGLIASLALAQESAKPSDAQPSAKTVTVETNGPTTPTATLTIHATVKPYVEAYPAGFVRYNLLQGDADSQIITLYSEEDDPFEITRIENPAGYVKTTYVKVEDE